MKLHYALKTVSEIAVSIYSEFHKYERVSEMFNGRCSMTNHASPNNVY